MCVCVCVRARGGEGVSVCESCEYNVCGYTRFIYKKHLLNVDVVPCYKTFVTCRSKSVRKKKHKTFRFFGIYIENVLGLSSESSHRCFSGFWKM